MRTVRNRVTENGYRLHGGIRFFTSITCVWAFLVGVPASADPAEPVVTDTQAVVQEREPAGAALVHKLVRARTPTLALAMLQDKQPTPEEDLADWLYWERLRITILTNNALWQRFDARLDALPKGVDSEFHHWAYSMRAEALIEQGEAERGRELLLRLIWREPDEISDEQLAQWRQLIIHAYLSEGRDADAYAAMLRYRQDYGRGSAEAVELFAQVLLTNGRSTEAESELRTLENHEDNPLFWLARLRNGTDAAAVVKRLRGLHGEKSEDPGAIYYAVLAEAAGAAGDLLTRASALEGLFARERIEERVQRVVTLDEEQLWQAYLDLARTLGNQARLLVGRDANWIALADKHTVNRPTASRALYAFLSLYSYDDSARDDYHRRLAKLLLTEDQGRWLVERLYLASPRFIEVVAIPEVVRRVLVDYALASADLDLAARLLKDFDVPPEGANALMWQLRRAKVLLLTGENAQGVAILEGMLDKLGEMETAQFDRYVQTLFDLQTIGEHAVAYKIFLTLYERIPDLRIKRELLFWMADSRYAEEGYLDAGYLYLQSAILIDQHSMDPWAQTARYQAAKSLTKAALYQDAENLYRQLLKVTTETDRKSQLLRDLEQLKLLRSASRRQTAL